MTTIVDHLDSATDYLRLAQTDLTLACMHATSRRYAPNWIHAIKKALTDTEAASTHITNIAKCLAPFSDPPE